MQYIDWCRSAWRTFYYIVSRKCFFWCLRRLLILRCIDPTRGYIPIKVCIRLRVDCPLKPNSGIKCECITPDDFDMQPGGPIIADLPNNRDTHCACWAPAAHVSFCKSQGPTSLSTDKLTIYRKHLWAAALIAVTESVFSSAVAGYCVEFACFWQRCSSFSCYQNEIREVNAPYPDPEQSYKTDVNSKCFNLLIKWRLKKVKITNLNLVKQQRTCLNS